MKNYRDNIAKDKNILNYSECIKLFNDSHMRKIGEGGQGDVFKVMSDKCGCIILKYYRKGAYESVKKKYNVLEELKKEYNILVGLKIFIDYRYCPNYIKIIDTIPEKQWIIMEYADHDCKNLFNQSNIDSKIIYSFFCQTLIGLLCFQKLNFMIHNDFKLENILYKKIDERVVFNYKINGQEYYIPSYGYLFMLSDFGMCLDTKYYENVIEGISEYSDIIRLRNSIDTVIIKKLFSNEENKNLNLFTSENKIKLKQINQKLLPANLDDVQQLYNKELKSPLLNNEELKNYGYDSEIVRIKNILNEKIELIDIIKKIIGENKTNKNYDKKYVEEFSFNYQD